MSKLAIKTKVDLSKHKVFLKRAYDGHMEFGYLELIDKRDNHTNVIGKIKNNLLQDDITIGYDDEIEKLKILSAIPDTFYYRVNMNTQRIIISYKRENINAPLFINREYVDRFYKFLTCFDEEEKVTLSVTLKTPELTQRIMELHRKVLEVKKEFYPKRYMTKYQAAIDVKHYLIWLMENYKVEIVEDEELSEYMQNLRKYYNNSDIELYMNCLKTKLENYQFQFIYDDKTFKVTIGSKKAGDYFEDYGGFDEYFERYVENLKAQNDYYVEGTTTPKYEVEEQENF